MTFEEAIAPYENIKRTYQEALQALALVSKGDPDHRGLAPADIEYFVSQHCRAYFFWNYLRVEREASDQEIRNIDESPIVPFCPSSVQLRVLDRFEARIAAGKKFRHRVMKCRRAKISTIYLAIGYHFARFSESKKGLVFSDRLDTSRKLRRILEIFYQNDSLNRKPTFGKKTLGEGLYLHHENSGDGTDRDSFILLGSAEQSNPGIGGSLDWMLWSEAALSDDAVTHWTTISPSLQGALFDVAESTPALSGQDPIIFPSFESAAPNCDAIFISWLQVPEYRIDDPDAIANFVPFDDHNLYGKEKDIMASHSVTVPQMLWRRFKLDELRNAHAFKQVFPISPEEAFYSGAGLFFHKDLIVATKPKSKVDGVSYAFVDQGLAGMSMIPDEAGMWKVYKSPAHSANYLVVADPAEGKTSDKEQRDSDYFCSMIFELGRVVEEVAILRDRIPPEVGGEQLVAAAQLYNSAMIVPERNNAGLAVLTKILPVYGNVYKSQRLQGGTFVMTQDYGYCTTTVTKPFALSCLLAKLRAQEIILHSDIARIELGKFIQSGSKYGAAAGFHDDSVSCLWLMAVALFQMPGLAMDRADAGRPGGGSTYEPKIERDSQ